MKQPLNYTVRCLLMLYMALLEVPYFCLFTWVHLFSAAFSCTFLKGSARTREITSNYQTVNDPYQLPGLSRWALLSLIFIMIWLTIRATERSCLLLSPVSFFVFYPPWDVRMDDCRCSLDLRGCFPAKDETEITQREKKILCPGVKGISISWWGFCHPMFPSHFWWKILC